MSRGRLARPVTEADANLEYDLSDLRQSWGSKGSPSQCKEGVMPPISVYIANDSNVRIYCIKEQEEEAWIRDDDHRMSLWGSS